MQYSIDASLIDSIERRTLSTIYGNRVWSYNVLEYDPIMYWSMIL